MHLKLKFTFAFFLYFITFQVLAISTATCTPIKLKQKELHSIFKSIKYPKSKLKHRSWESKSCYLSDPKEKTKNVYVESTNYEQGSEFERYYANRCDNFRRWKCYQSDIFRLRKNGEKIILNNKISTVEVLQLIEVISKLDFSSIRDVLPNGKMNIERLSKDDKYYFASLQGRDTHCWSGVLIFPTSQGGFRSGKPNEVACE